MPQRFTQLGDTVQDGEIYGAPLRAVARGNQFADAQALHEHALDEKTQTDMAKLSLAQQALLVKRSSAIEGANYHRAVLATQYRRNIAAAAAIDKLKELDTTSPSYLKERGAVLANYSEALPSSALQNFLKTQDDEHASIQKSIAARDASTFSGQANDAWNKIYSQTGNIDYANKIAGATKDMEKRAMNIVTSPHVDPALRSQIYDPKTGQLNINDDALLTKAEVGIETQKNALAAATDTTKQAGTDLAALTKAAASDDPDIAFNAKQALKNKTYSLMKGGTPDAAAAVPGAVASAFQTYLGKPAATPTPTPTVAPAPPASPVVPPTVPPVTAAVPPAAPLPSETPAPTPPAVPTPTAPPNLGGGDELAGQ